MRALAVLLVALVPMAAGAQISFERTYGGSDDDGGESVCETSDGGHIIAGWTGSFGAGANDVYLVRTNHLGDTLWTRAFGGAGSDRGYSVAETGDGGCIIVGYTNSFGAGYEDVYLIKTDSLGDIAWTSTFGGTGSDRGYSVAETGDGGYIVAGHTSSFGAGHEDVYLIKTDALGHTVWARTYGGSDRDYGRSVAQTGDGGYIIAGYTSSFGTGQHDVYLIKTDALGDTAWTRTYGGLSWDHGRSVVQTGDGGYIIAGYTSSFGAGSWDVYLVKTDALGDTAWTRTYGGTSNDLGRSVVETSGGGYLIAGYTNSFGGGYEDVYLIKTDAAGDLAWTCTHGGSGYDEGYSAAQTDDGGYIIAGSTESYGAGYIDVYLVKTDADGLVGMNHPPDLVDQADTAVAENQYLTFTLQAIDPELDSIAFSSPDLPESATLDEVTGEFEWTPTIAQIGVHTITFIAADFGEPALADTEQTNITVGDVNLPPDLTDQPDTTIAEEQYLTFALEATDPDGDSIWFSSPDLPEGAAIDALTGVFWWTPTYAQSGLYTVTFIATDMSYPALSDTEQTDITVTDAVGIAGDEDEAGLLALYLAQNHPNPFGSSTTVCYSLRNEGPATVAVYDVRGALVRLLVDERVAAGVHRVVWDGRDGRGREVGSGIYFCRLEAGEFTETRRMVLLR